MLAALALLISIHTDFEGGSLGKVEKLSDTHFRCALTGEADQDKRNRQVSWYYFRVDHAAGREITIDLADLVGEYNYKPGARAIKKSTPGVYSYDNQTWTHFDDSQWQEGEASTIRLRFTPARSPVWLAHVPPYTTAHLARLLAEFRRHPHLKRETAGKTAGGREMLLLTVTNPVGQVHDLPRPGQVGDPPHFESGKKVVWLLFRQHSWEAGSSWAGEGALRYLLSAEAAGLRDRFVFKIFPMADPDGVARGGVRFNVNGYDLNRNWDAVDPKTMPEIAAQRKAVFDWLDSGHKVDLFFSLHNDEEPEYIESAAGPLAQRFYETLAATTSFNPNRKPVDPGVSTTPGKPGRMNVCQGLSHDRGIPCVLMEQQTVFNSKLGHYPEVDDRLKFGRELVQAIAATLAH